MEGLAKWLHYLLPKRFSGNSHEVAKAYFLRRIRKYAHIVQSNFQEIMKEDITNIIIHSRVFWCISQDLNELKVGNATVIGLEILISIVLEIKFFKFKHIKIVLLVLLVELHPSYFCFIQAIFKFCTTFTADQSVTTYAVLCSLPLFLLRYFYFLILALRFTKTNRAKKVAHNDLNSNIRLLNSKIYEPLKFNEWLI